ncbi:hypothetical protein AAVH_38067 [Aphelenchoides avenae]|nr:hypothetical protein AAVH_38067 [Aphelenchus avenae]
MPLHRIYHVAGAFTDEQKQRLANAITQIYLNGMGLPAFYVVVLFISPRQELAANRRVFERLIPPHTHDNSEAEQEWKRLYKAVLYE